MVATGKCSCTDLVYHTALVSLGLHPFYARFPAKNIQHHLSLLLEIKITGS
jgi:hypothetical protein